MVQGQPYCSMWIASSRSTKGYTYVILLTILKIFPIATTTVGYTMDIQADEYTAQWTAQAKAATTPPQWPWHLSSQCFLNEQYIVFTYIPYSLIQTQRDCIHTVGLDKLKLIFECKKKTVHSAAQKFQDWHFFKSMTHENDTHIFNLWNRK